MTITRAIITTIVIISIMMLNLITTSSINKTSMNVLCLAINKNSVEFVDFYKELDDRLYRNTLVSNVYSGLFLYNDKDVLIRSLDDNKTYYMYSTLTGKLPNNIVLLNQPLFTGYKSKTYNLVSNIGYDYLIPESIIISRQDDIKRKLLIAINTWDKFIIKPSKGKGGDFSAYYVKRNNDIIIGNKFGYKLYNKNIPQETVMLEIIKHMTYMYDPSQYDVVNNDYESTEHIYRVMNKLRNKYNKHKNKSKLFDSLILQKLYMNNDGVVGVAKVYVVITNHERLHFDSYYIISQSNWWIPYASGWFGKNHIFGSGIKDNKYIDFIRKFIANIISNGTRVVDMSFDFVYDQDEDELKLLEVNSRPSKDFVQHVDDDMKDSILDSYTNAITSALLYYS